MKTTYTIILTNNSYSDDIRYSEVFDRVPTRQDVEDEFVTISSGDHPSQTYTVISSDGGEVGGITCTESEYDEENDKWSDDEYSWGCISDPTTEIEVYGPGHPDY